jgi:hypothetical protein
MNNDKRFQNEGARGTSLIESNDNLAGEMKDYGYEQTTGLPF